MDKNTEETKLKRQQEKERLEAYRDLKKDERKVTPSGVLLCDEIKHYVSLCSMIDPFCEKNLKAAGYELTVGDEYSLGGKPMKLGEGEEIRIEAFQVAIIKTHETLNLPRFIIARWNIRVRWAYEGLLWVGGPQVDPGWVGHLSCPIYNLSDKPVTLRFGDPLALMDFVTTTPYSDESANHEYPRPPKRPIFEDYKTVKSALYTEARQRINDIRDETERRVGRIEALVSTFIAVTITVFAVLFAVLALFVSPPHKAVSWWTIISAVFSVSAVVLSVYVLFRTKDLTNK